MSDAYEQDAGSTDSELDFSRYLWVVLRHIWLVLIVAALASAGGIWLLKQRTPLYRAAAQIILETEQQQILGEVDPIVDPIGNSYFANREYVQTQLRVIRSRSIAESVATELDLQSDMEFLGIPDDIDEAARRDALESADAAAMVQASLTVEPVEDSRLINVIVTTTNPRTSAAVANAVARGYVNRNLERRVESIEGAAGWLEEQHDVLRERLEESEEALVRFRRDNNILAVTLKDNVSLLSSMESLTQQLAESRLQTERLRHMVADIEAALQSDDIAEVVVEPVIESTLVQGLKQRIVELEVQIIDLETYLLPTHPEVMALREQHEVLQAALEREIRAILEVWQERYRNARSVESSLAARLSGVENEVQELGEHEVNYNRLLREAEGNRELFSLIERRLKEVDLTRNAQYNNVDVLEPAVPSNRPYNPNGLADIALVVAVALALGIGAAFALDSLDNTVRSKEELERDFGLTFLGVIPAMRISVGKRPGSRDGPARGEKWNPNTFVFDYPKSMVAESCRSIRTNLMFLGGEDGLRRMLVTSAGPRDGKTTTTSNIGAVFAQSGLKVLLIDADMRRPRLHETFGMERAVGLSSVLMGEMSPGEAIQETPIDNLSIMTSGPIPPNPTELMHTERFREVVRELDEMFDCVIFDTPPVTPVTDATLLSTSVDGVLLVVRAGKTRRELVKRTLDSLRAVRANIFGVVMNDLDLTKRQYGYYGSSYYYRRASRYYGSDVEEV